MQYVLPSAQQAAVAYCEGLVGGWVGLLREAVSSSRKSWWGHGVDSTTGKGRWDFSQDLMRRTHGKDQQ